MKLIRRVKMDQVNKNQIEGDLKAATPQRSVELSKRLVIILDKLLAAGDWDASSFLKKARERLRELRDEAQKIVDKFNRQEPIKGETREELETGLIKVFISLYQVEGGNLQIWLNTIRSLALYNMARPTYREEEHVRDLIHSKADQKRHGYIEIMVNEYDIIPITPLPIDTLGHELLILKEGAVKLDKVIKFIHANKKIYKFSPEKLIYEGDIES